MNWHDLIMDPDSPATAFGPSVAAEAARMAELARYGVADIGLDFTDPDLDLVVDLVQSMTGAPSAAVHIIQQAVQVRIAAAGAPRDITPRSASLCSRVMWLPEELYVTDRADLVPLLADSPWVNGELAALRFYASAPLIAEEGTPLGTVCVWSDEHRNLDDTQRRTLAKMAKFVVRVLELRRKAAEFEHSALHDALTGLPNRRYFQEYLKAALDRGHTDGAGPILLVVDIDHFKQINDRHGHDMGDQVLVTVAETLRVLALGRGVAARWGGDEFVVLLGSTADAAESVETLTAEVNRRLAEHSPEVTVTLTLGGARPAEHDTVEDLLRAADLDMYDRRRTTRTHPGTLAS
ncbi:GGDEF domain-containing protein [Nakamurella silvestris]|nr:GGDEF domain-containing protein [Nakamurella silvestris]